VGTNPERTVGFGKKWVLTHGTSLPPIG
jgi:hypothetical protein